MASTDVIGKIFGIWLPAAYFIIGGFEHCIANQYLLFQV
jgi:formate/nitrite transporter FocA (FNT family)